MADAPQLTLCPDASLRTKMVAASTARAQIRPSGIARLTSRVVFYTRDIEDRSYASAYVDTYIPPAGQADQFFLPRYTGFREATIFRTAGDAIVIGVTASDQMYIQDDHNEMFRIVNDPAAGTGGRDRLLRSPHTKGRAISNWAAVKKECLESMDDIVTQEEDGVYVKPARTGIKIVTLRQEFDDASQDGTPTKTVLVRSPAMNQRKGVTIDDLVGTTVNMICLIKYRVVLNLKEKNLLFAKIFTYTRSMKLSKLQMDQTTTLLWRDSSGLQTTKTSYLKYIRRRNEATDHVTKMMSRDDCCCWLL